MARKINGVIDRITDGKKVIILCETINKQFELNCDELNFQVKEGLWLDITLDTENNIQAIERNDKLTKEKEEGINYIMSRLKKRKGSKFRN